jgi:hypothetical protein
MRKLLFSISLLSCLFLGGCVKNDPVTFTDNKIEFDAATWNSNAAGFTYPIMASTPNQGFAGGTGTLSRSTGTFKIRINLLGTQISSASTFNYSVVATESTAIAGTHYTALSGTGTIPANSSFGFIDIPLLNPGVSSATPVVLVLELLPNGSILPNTNYAKIGFRISQL